MRPSKSETEAYLRQHDVGPRLAVAVNEAILAKAVDPIKLIAEKLGAPSLLRSGLPQSMGSIQADTSKTCVQRVQEALDVIAQREGDLNACIEILKSSALQQAAEADEKLAGGAARRPLEGVPLLVKGNVDVQGTLSTAAMEGFAGWRPSTTAPVVQKLIDAGAIVVAKTTLPEAAFGMWSWSKLHGLTKNPFNSRYTAGGSSMGSSVGLAAGYAPIAIGSDTEGSMRGPAEYAGIVGLRPTMGRYSNDGIIPCNIARDTAGMMACTAADVAMLDAIATGGQIGDYQPPALSSVKVAYPADWAAMGKAPGTQKALALAVAAFEGGGATVKKEVGDFKPLLTPPVPPDDSLYEAVSFRSEALESYIKSHENIGTTLGEVIDKSFYPSVKRFFAAPIQLGKGAMINMREKQGTEEYGQLKVRYDKEVAAMAEQFTKYLDNADVDVILTPCTVGLPSAVKTAAEYHDPTSFGPLIMASLGNFLPLYGLNGVPIPSITLPTAARHENPELGGGPMPAGVLLWARPKDDKKLVEVAMALEAALAAAA